MHSIRRTFIGPSLLQKIQRNRAISNTFHNDLEKRNPHQSKSWRRRL